MDEVREALRENRNVRVRPLARAAGVTPALIYAVIKRESLEGEGVVRIGRAVRVTPRLARRFLGEPNE